MLLESVSKSVIRKTWFLVFWFIIPILIFSLQGIAFPKEKEGYLKVNLFPKEVHQGNICVVELLISEGMSLLGVEFQGKGLPFFEVERGKSFRALIGVDMESPPRKYKLLVSAKNSSGIVIQREDSIKVVKKDFGIQRLTLPKKMVDLNKKTLKRVRKEIKGVKDVWPRTTKDRFWTGEFIRPLRGKVLSPFGVRRFLNNQPRSPHSGVDLRGKMGEEILCSNTGIVALVGELYFNGKTVIVDHGQGLFTMYFHLSRINVKEGQMIEKGKVLGLVGSSGRATGPHLHWGARLHGARVDPLMLLDIK